MVYTTVMVVDDQPMFRRAISMMVRAVGGLLLIGEAATGEESVELAAELAPDLILMDVRLPGIDGVEATRRILARQPRIRVVLISTYEAADLPSAWRDCGALQYLRKQDLDELSLRTAAAA